MAYLDLIDGEDELSRRTSTGEQAIQLAERRLPTDAEERETFATDVISDILTAIYGPAGTCSVGGSLDLNEQAIADAMNLLHRAVQSWQGDAEDYVRRPEPGEYGYEAPDETRYDGWDGEPNDLTTITVELDVSGLGTFGGLKRNVESALERGGLTGIRGVRITGKRS